MQLRCSLSDGWLRCSFVINIIHHLTVTHPGGWGDMLCGRGCGCVCVCLGEWDGSLL